MPVNRRRYAQVILSVCLALGATGCTGFDVLNSMVPSCGYARTTDISYGSLPRQKLDIYRPRNAPTNARVVIFFYGGEWEAGKKDNYRFVGEALTTQGFVAVLPDYRLYPDVTFPAFVKDGALAFRWVHDHIADFGGDPSRIYLMGHSAGAHIAALLTLDGHYLKDVGLDRSDIRATVGMSGPYWFDPFPQDRGIFNMKPTETKVDPAIEPLNFADGHGPPMLLLQGMRDTLVDPENAFALATLINHNGGRAKVIWYNDRGHRSVLIALASEFRWLAPVLRDASEFIRQH